MDAVYFLLCAILHIIMTRVQSEADLKVAVVGERVTLECRRTGTRIQWDFHRFNRTTPYSIYNQGIVPDEFKAEYEVTKSVQDIFHLVIKSATILEAGKYVCKDPVDPEDSTSTLKLDELLIFTVPKCKAESTAESHGVNTTNITCTFNVVGNLSSITSHQQEVCGDPVICVKLRNDNINCTPPLDAIGIFNQTPAVTFDPGIPASQMDNCEILCLTRNNIMNSSSLDATVHLKCVLNSTGDSINLPEFPLMVIVVVSFSIAVLILSAVIAVICCICCKKRKNLEVQSNSKSRNEPFGRHENEAIQESQYSEIFKPEVSYSFPHDHCISENSAYMDPQYDAIEDVLPREILKEKKTGKQSIGPDGTVYALCSNQPKRLDTKAKGPTPRSNTNKSAYVSVDHNLPAPPLPPLSPARLKLL